MSVNKNKRVESLFSKKAEGWSEKYSSGSLDVRLRRFVEEVKKEAEVGSKVLDFGCGTGDISLELSRYGYKVHACDFSKDMIKRSPGGNEVEWRVLDTNWSKLPYERSSFDIVVASSVFEYLEDKRNVICQIGKVLKRGGKLIFSVPNVYNYVRRIESFTRRFISDRFVKEALKVSTRAGKFLRYLNISQNRYEPEEWASFLAEGGFLPSNEKKSSEKYWKENIHKQLIIMTFVKVDNNM